MARLSFRMNWKLHGSRPQWAALVGAVLIAACGGSASTAGQTPGSGKPIIIGNVESQTGFMQHFDGPTGEGLDLAIHDINAKGGVMGRQLQVVRADSKTSKTENYTAALQVISQGASVVITSNDFDLGSPGALAAQSAKVIAFSGAAADPKFGKIGHYVFTMGATTNDMAAVAAEFSYQKKNFRSVWTLTDQTLEYSKSYTVYFKDRFTGLGGSVLGDATFSNGDTSIAAQIGQYQSLATKPDFIWISSYVPGGGTAIRQIRQAGIKVPIVVTESNEGSLFFDTAGSTVTDVYGLMHGWIYGGNPNPAADAIVGEYQSTYGHSPDTSQIFLGYAVGLAIAKGMEDCQCTGGDGLANALEKFQNVKLGAITTSYSTSEHFPISRPMVVWEATGNGQRTLIDTITPTNVPAPSV